MIEVQSYIVTGCDGDEVLVERSDYRGPSVRVTWPCGDRLLFTEEDALSIIRNVKLARKHDVPISLEDSQGTSFYVTVDDGEFYAAESLPILTSGASHVPWRDLRKAVKQLLKEEEAIAA